MSDMKLKDPETARHHPMDRAIIVGLICLVALLLVLLANAWPKVIVEVGTAELWKAVIMGVSFVLLTAIASFTLYFARRRSTVHRQFEHQAREALSDVDGIRRRWRASRQSRSDDDRRAAS